MLALQVSTDATHYTYTYTVCILEQLERIRLNPTRYVTINANKQHYHERWKFGTSLLYMNQLESAICYTMHESILSQCEIAANWQMRVPLVLSSLQIQDYHEPQ